MATSTFKTNPYKLQELLNDCHRGKLQLPDFQRSWVWDEDRIRSLVASVSRAFPVGALMTLETGGTVDFKPRLIEGASSNDGAVYEPDALLLDGQQRMTSLYQVAFRRQVVETVTAKKKTVRRWFYIDIDVALDPTADREDAIVTVPEDKIVRSNFARTVDLDLSTRRSEYENKLFPVSMVFQFAEWSIDFVTYYNSEPDFRARWDELQRFNAEVIENFTHYHVPVISLDSETSKEAVCVVFEKVNTGGKPLDAFELITAMYAADGHELRKDWYGTRHEPGIHGRLSSTNKVSGSDSGILEGVANTEFLHVIALFYTRDRRLAAIEEGRQGRDLPQVIGNRSSLLNLPLDAYLKYKDRAELGFKQAAKFLHMLHIYRRFDLPYQSQIVPLAAILADIGDKWQHSAHREKIERWYWSGVFGELYGSTTETRIAKDFTEVPLWLDGGPEPTTVRETAFRSDRLKTMRMRLSAAYKGVNALLMLRGALDFRSGQKFDHTIFFGENVDIHHIFPKKWCETNNIPPRIYDSIINKTPLSFQTNRSIGGSAPSLYMAGLESATPQSPAIDPADLDKRLESHLIDPEILRSDDFESFMQARQAALVLLIESAVGKPVIREEDPNEAIDAEDEDDELEAIKTLDLTDSVQA